MYILKNALRSINRSKGRSILIGIIIFVIAISSCIALSIREAAESAREDSLSGLEITAQITANRQNMMAGKENREEMQAALGEMEELSLEDMEGYAASSYVKEFYYSGSASLNGSNGLEAVDMTGTSSDDSNGADSLEQPENRQMMRGQSMGSQGDFTLTGYSSDNAMTSFLDGSCSISDGSMFPEQDDNGNCVISEELATYNNLSVGDTLTLANPNDEEETFTLTISGIYTNSQTGDSAGNMMGGFFAAFDSANQIYTSYKNLENIAGNSTSLHAMTTGTYTFADVKDYEAFKEETESSLGENYTVTSNDVTQYEQSLIPLENLSSYAGYFLLIILLIGAVILVVLNIFNVRERKYEIGVLAAIGMKKSRIAGQFITELLVVTFAAILIGAGAGAAVSVPVTNTLLEQQIQSSSAVEEQQDKNFGRDRGQGGPSEMTETGEPPEIPEGSTAPDSGEKPGFSGFASRYISEIDSAANLTVILQMMGIGLLLTVISACVAVIFILRYDPLRILSNRD